MIGADKRGASPAGYSGGRPSAGQVAPGVSVRLVDPGQQPLEVLGVLFKMGCPAELAYDYLEAAVLGQHPEVLVGADAPAASQLADALRTSGALVEVEPPLEPPVDAGPVEVPTVVPLAGHSPGSGVDPTGPTSSRPAPEPSPGEPSEPKVIVLSGGPSSPSMPQLIIETVERYIASYNAGNEPQLVDCLSATAVLSDATGRVLVEGAPAIGRRMAEVFTHYPDGRITVVGRQVAGPWVLDHHRTSYGGGASEETVLCFRVDDGRIDRLVLLTMA